MEIKKLKKYPRGIALLLLVALGSTAATDPPPVARLLGLHWSTTEQLQALAALDLPVRYVARGLLVVDDNGDLLPALTAQGMRPLFVDSPTPGEEYYLANHLHEPLPPALRVVYQDSSGKALVCLGPGEVSGLFAAAHFLWPLPAEFNLEGWLDAAPRAKPVVRASAEAMDALLAQVDADRLRRHVEMLALEEPALGSVPGNVRSRFAVRGETFAATQYIRDQLAAVLGEEAVEIQPFGISPRRVNSYVSSATEEAVLEDTTAYNVVGTLAGTDPEAGYYVICAHYDAIAVRSRGWDWRIDPAPGADDNATGIALVLECARLLAGRSFPWSIRFIAFSGEELGLLGSRQYATDAAARDDRILGVLNFDMVGFNDLKLRMELVTNPGSRWLAEEMIAVNDRYAIGLDLDVLEDGAALLSDHAPFWARGYDAILGIENYLPIDSTTYGVREGIYRINTQYHSMADLPDSVNWDLVRRTTQLTLGTLAQYGLEQDAGQLPNLAVFSGDLSGGQDDQLRLRISNIGLGAVTQPYRVRVWQCGLDSTGCQFAFAGEGGALPPGGGEDLAIPWNLLGEQVLLVEVDADDRIAETNETDNRVFQRVRLVPRTTIVVYPNPFQPEQRVPLRFSGVPLAAEVRVFSLDGQLVWAAREDDAGQRALGASANEVLWFGVNVSGAGRGRSLVGSGIYVYSITSAEGELLRRDKIAVIRP